MKISKDQPNENGQRPLIQSLWWQGGILAFCYMNGLVTPCMCQRLKAGRGEEELPSGKRGGFPCALIGGGWPGGVEGVHYAMS